MTDLSLHRAKVLDSFEAGQDRVTIDRREYRLASKTIHRVEFVTAQPVAARNERQSAYVPMASFIRSRLQYDTEMKRRYDVLAEAKERPAKKGKR